MGQAPPKLAASFQIPREDKIRSRLYEVADESTGLKPKAPYLGGAGRGGFGPNARAVSRWSRFVRESARQLRRSLFLVIRARE